MSTGKIAKKLQIDKNEIIEECITDETNQRMIIVSSSIQKSSLFIIGFSYRVNEKVL